MKGANGILCTVHLWIISVLPLLLAVERMSPNSYVEEITSHPRARRALYKLFFTQAVLEFFMAVFLFSLHGMRVLWPRGFKGEFLLHGIDCRGNGRRMLIEWQAMDLTTSSTFQLC
jgi:uncharacterized membrane protein